MIILCGLEVPVASFNRLLVGVPMKTVVLEAKMMVDESNGDAALLAFQRVSAGVELLRSWRAKSRWPSLRYVGLILPPSWPSPQGGGGRKWIIGGRSLRLRESVDTTPVPPKFARDTTPVRLSSLFFKFALTA